MELRHLRYFVAAAEESHFTRAAKRLGIAQPPLSQQIQQLEKELGFLLFHRLARGVSLTEAGENFLVNARSILDRLDVSVNSAREIAQGTVGTIRIGFTSTAAFNDFVPRVVGDFRKLYPDVVISLHEATSMTLVQQLRGGEVDTAFLRLAEDEGRDLLCDQLFAEEMRLAVPVDHSLAGRKSVELAELRDEKFVIFPRANGRSLFDAITAACEEAGFPPNIAQEAPQMASSISLVAAGVGVAFVTAPMCHLHPNRVRYVPIASGGPAANLYMATRILPLPAPVSSFLRLVKDVRRKSKAQNE